MKFLNEAEAGHKSYVTIDFVPSSRSSAQKRVWFTIQPTSSASCAAGQRIGQRIVQCLVGHSDDATRTTMDVWRLSPELKLPEPNGKRHIATRDGQ